MKILFGFIRTALGDAAVYRVDFWFGLLANFFLMYASASVWRILYEQSPGAFGVTAQQMISYGVLGVLLFPLQQNTGQVRNYIADQGRSGTLEIDLMKPIDFMLHMLARNIGSLSVAILLRVLPGFVFAVLVLGIKLPADLATFAVFLLSTALGYLVYFGINFMLGLVALITHEIRSYTWAFNAFARFASGEVIPLWLFPPGLRELVLVLPFQALYFVPLSIYTGTGGQSLAQALLGQCGWALGVLGICRLVWLRSQRRIVVQGG